jgi:hypothetical protein
VNAAATQSAKFEDLPEEIRQVIELKRLKKAERINALGTIVAKKRDEAVDARKQSGIERIWKEDEEYYLGIDDLNRQGNVFTKSMSTEGGLSGGDKKQTGGRATAFFNITRQFVDSASARMGDILLPAGDWNFAIKPTPVPELESIKKSTQQVVDPASGQPKANPDGSPYTMGQFAEAELADASKKVKKGETRIRDWLTECSYHSELRKVIDGSAKIGTGIIRGAYPGKSKSRVVLNGQLAISEKIVPSSKSISPWNFFPDSNCGDNIQNGGYVIERDYASARQLRDMKGLPDYLSENIDKVLKEGPGKKNKEGGIWQDGTTKDDDRFEVFYFFGDINIDDLEACDPKFVKEDNIERDAVPAVIVMINDTVVKGFLNPLDNGEFPYDIMPWQRIPDSPWGVGISRQGRVPQDMLNASARALMSNMGLSSAPQIIVRQSAVRPADGSWALVAGKIWIATEEADVKSVADAFLSVVIPSMQAEINGVIQLAYKMMEDATGVSFLLQGQQGSAPDTVGGMELLHKNSSALLRRISRVFDECVTEPHIRRYHDWLLIHGEDDEKGDLKIEAIGSTALVEREIQAVQANQILQMSLNPAFEMSPKKAKDELLRAWRFEPSKFDMDDEEKKAIAQKQPAPAPQIQAAQIRAASAEKLSAAKLKSDQEIMVAQLDHDEQMDQNDTDRDTIYTQSIANRDRNAYEARMAEMQLRERLAMLDYANKNKMQLEDVKAKLADTAMKIRTQKELAMMDGHSKQVLTPPTEPSGRAEDGKAFQQ